jgi:fucose permease
MLIMAIAGDAIFPVLYAALNTHFGISAGIGLLLALYAVIFYYARVGYKKMDWKN